MGQGATVGRRALIDRVKECLAQTNSVTGGVSKVREAHDALAQQTRADIKALKARFDVYKAWLERVERHETLTRELATDARQAVDRARVEAHRTLTDLTLWGRLRFFVTGYLPPLAPSESEAFLKQLEANGPWTPAEPPSVEPVRLTGGGMAPRPLP